MQRRGRSALPMAHSQRARCSKVVNGRSTSLGALYAPVSEELDIDRLARNAGPDRREVVGAGTWVTPMEDVNSSPAARRQSRHSHDASVHSVVAASLEKSNLTPTAFLSWRAEQDDRPRDVVLFQRGFDG